MYIYIYIIYIYHIYIYIYHIYIYHIYKSYKSLTNYQKNSNIKDKIKTNAHFDNTFTVNE